MLLKFSRLFIVLIVLSIFTACRQGQETPPVSREKMGKVILDMQLAEVYSQGLGDSVKNRFEKNTDSLAGFYTSILKHHGMTLPEFEDALAWYKERPLLLDSVYNKVLTQLIVIKAEKGIKDTEEGGPKDAPMPVMEDTAGRGFNTLKTKSMAIDSTIEKMEDSLLQKRKLK